MALHVEVYKDGPSRSWSHNSSFTRLYFKSTTDNDMAVRNFCLHSSAWIFMTSVSTQPSSNHNTNHPTPSKMSKLSCVQLHINDHDPDSPKEKKDDWCRAENVGTLIIERYCTRSEREMPAMPMQRSRCVQVDLRSMLLSKAAVYEIRHPPEASSTPTWSIGMWGWALCRGILSAVAQPQATN